MVECGFTLGEKMVPFAEWKIRIIGIQTGYGVILPGLDGLSDGIAAMVVGRYSSEVCTVLGEISFEIF